MSGTQETIFDHNVTAEELNELFKDSPELHDKNEYIKNIAPIEHWRLYHICKLMTLRGDEVDAEKYNKLAGHPFKDISDYCY
jgi:hypothetical protein